jgi:anti-sigma factor RsiW
MTYVSDELLLAYIDGQLEETQAAGVARLSTANPDIARRVRRLKRTQGLFLDTFGGLASGRGPVLALGPNAPSRRAAATAPASPPALRSGVRHAARAQSGRWRQPLFLAMVFAGGILGGYGATLLKSQMQAPATSKITERQVEPAAATATATATPSWSADIARFHAFFPKETLTPHADAISNPELIAFQLTKVTGRPIVPPDFTRNGYTLYRGQAFNYQQDRMMQLTYQSKTEPPLTVYVLGAGAAADAPAVTVAGQARAVFWVADRVRFLLTADKSEQDLKMLAVIAQSQMPRRG